jgi:hypothetical protein
VVWKYRPLSKWDCGKKSADARMLKSQNVVGLTAVAGKVRLLQEKSDSCEREKSDSCERKKLDSCEESQTTDTRNVSFEVGVGQCGHSAHRTSCS